jgi:hypothetical protein
MRRHDHVWKSRKAIVRLPRFDVMHVEPGARDHAGGEGSNNASSSTSRPRLVLMKRAVRFMDAKAARPTSRSFGPIFEACTETRSDSASKTSRGRQDASSAVGVDDRPAEGACTLNDESNYVPEV